MSISAKYGGLPWLSWVFDYGPLSAAVIVIVADFLIIAALMVAEGIPPWQRSLYKAFLWNDTIFIPLYAVMVVIVLRESQSLAGFYTSEWWHWSLLTVGVTASLLLEIGAVKSGQFTLSQELSPSKLWHTFIFGVVAYWLASTVIPVLVVVFRDGRWGEFGVVLVAMVGFVVTNYLDSQNLQLPDAHLEGTWWPWEWYRRQ